MIWLWPLTIVAVAVLVAATQTPLATDPDGDYPWDDVSATLAAEDRDWIDDLD